MKKIFITGMLLLLVLTSIYAELQEVSGAAKKDLRSAGMYYRQKVFDKARTFYGNVLEANPYHIESLFNIAGMLYELDKDYETAYEYYARVLEAIDMVYAEYDELNATDAKAAKKYHKKYIKKADLEDIKDKSGTLQSNCWTLIYQQGYKNYSENNFEEALKVLEKLKAMAPDSVKTVKMIGNTYLKLENVEAAIGVFEELYVLEPENEKNPQLIANQYFNLDDKAKAAEWYGKAAEINPENPDNYFNMGICYSSLQQREESLAMFAKTLEYQPDNYDAIYNAKILAQQLEDMDNFLKYSEMEFELNGYTVEGLKTFCYQLNGLEANEAVIKFSNKWAELAPDDPAPYQLMFLAADRMGDKSAADKYQKMLQKFN